jgi:O-glycosyl hydrolase
VEHVGFANPDGSYVLVLTNSGEGCDVECRFREKALSLKVPRNSVITLQWS